MDTFEGKSQESDKYSKGKRRLSSHSVARADLTADSASSEPPSAIDANSVEKLSEAFGNVQESGKPTTTLDNGRAIEEKEDGSFEFRLFARAGPAKTELQRIELRSPTPTAHDSDAAIARRPKEYYFAGDATEEQARKYQEAAVSGSDIIAGLNTKWKGCELPWRVTFINARPVSKNGRTSPLEQPQDGKKKSRKGKKTRIAIRKRTVIANALKAQKEQSKEEKEEAEKEKRNRRNREKKLKRRQKQRDAKTTQAAEAD